LEIGEVGWRRGGVEESRRGGEVGRWRGEDRRRGAGVVRWRREGVERRCRGGEVRR
jgi:hypothetical protein